MVESDPERRSGVLDQLHYLLEEITALKPMLSRMHEEQIIDEQRGPSVKQCYGAIVMRDRNLILPTLNKHFGIRESEAFQSRDWNRLPIEEILAEVAGARKAVIKAAEKLVSDDWTREIANGMDVYHFLLTVSHKDADTLREIAQKLYRSP